jgi:hypothetical protein
VRNKVAEYRVRIYDIPEEERPRERLVKFGAAYRRPLIL